MKKQNRRQVVLMKPLTKRQFDKLSADEKRVLIAKDVLAQLKLGRYVAESGTYIDGVQDSFYGTDAKPDDPLHELLNKTGRNAPDECMVCGIGAACLSAVRLFDQAKYDEVYNFDGEATAKELDMWMTVQCYFPDATDGGTSVIEQWFERHHGDGEWTNIADGLRLEAIYRRVVNNGGRMRGLFTEKNWWRKCLDKQHWEKFAAVDEARAELDKLEAQIAKAEDRKQELEAVAYG